MKKFVLASVLFAALFAGVIVLVKAMLPYDAGNKAFREKKQYLLEHIEEYNTLFMGSSRTQRQIDPALVDSVTRGRTQSFNLGVDATFIPELWYLYHELIDELDSGDLQYIFMELSQLNISIGNNLHTVRGTYFVNEPVMDFVQQYVARSSMDDSARQAVLHDYRLAHTDQVIAPGLLFYYASPMDNSDAYNALLSEAGFAPYTTPFKIPQKNLAAKRRHEDIINDRIHKLKIHRRQNNNDEIPYNQFYANELDALVAKAEEKGIRLIFLSPPMNFSRDLWPIIDSLTIDELISFEAIQRYPQLYSPEYIYDRTHLNPEGARIYSVVVGREINKRLRRIERQLRQAERRAARQAQQSEEQGPQRDRGTMAEGT